MIPIRLVLNQFSGHLSFKHYKSFSRAGLKYAYFFTFHFKWTSKSGCSGQNDLHVVIIHQTRLLNPVHFFLGKACGKALDKDNRKRGLCCPIFLNQRIEYCSCLCYGIAGDDKS